MKRMTVISCFVCTINYLQRIGVLLASVSRVDKKTCAGTRIVFIQASLCRHSHSHAHTKHKYPYLLESRYYTVKLCISNNNICLQVHSYISFYISLFLHHISPNRYCHDEHMTGIASHTEIIKNIVSIVEGSNVCCS